MARAVPVKDRTHRQLPKPPKPPANAQKGALDTDAILAESRKQQSRHKAEAEQQRHHEVDQHLERLEKKDVIAAEMAKITEIKSTGFKCKECDRIFEFRQKFCAEMNHSVTQITGIKRFFECKGCRARIVAYCTMYPAHPCPKCRGGDWQRASMWKEFSGPELRPKMLPRGEEGGFSLRSDPLMMHTPVGDGD